MQEDLWSAPVALGPVRARISVPGSKSVTNRALVLAALSDGQTRISRPLHARDTNIMADALRHLGVGIEEVETSQGIDWLVTPAALTGPSTIDCGLAGTVMRFLPPVAALATGVIHFDGDPRARLRPMAGIIDALRQLGVTIHDDGRGTLPFTLDATGTVRGGEVTLDASASSQFVSALLLAGARFDEGIIVHHRGNNLPSVPHIDMSVAMLRDRGVVVDVEMHTPQAATWHVHPGAIRSLSEVVEPDLSNALPFLAAAMVTGGTVTIPDWPAESTQPGAQLPHLLEQMGATTQLNGAELTVTGPVQLRGIDADLGEVGELTPVLTAICALAETPSRLTGIAHLRGHETDRLSALANEFNKLGGNVQEFEDGLTIIPQTLHGGTFETYEDHRMATTAAVVGLRTTGVEVVDIATTGKTLPNFARMWHAMLEGDQA